MHSYTSPIFNNCADWCLRNLDCQVFDYESRRKSWYCWFYKSEQDCRAQRFIYADVFVKKRQPSNKFPSLQADVEIAGMAVKDYATPIAEVISDIGDITALLSTEQNDELQLSTTSMLSNEPLKTNPESLVIPLVKPETTAPLITSTTTTSLEKGYFVLAAEQKNSSTLSKVTDNKTYEVNDKTPSLFLTPNSLQISKIILSFTTSTTSKFE